MRQIVPTGDERVLAACIYCGAAPDTRDHVASRVLLDDPFPENLPVVPSCRACNTSFSLDEEYVAALIDCVMVGATAPNDRHREKIRRILERQPALSAAIHSGRSSDPATGTTAFAAELDRVKNVVLKLAKGHAAFELHTVDGEEPSAISVVPLQLLDENAREAFETPPDACMFPEVGSRAMTRMFAHGVPSPSWIIVQPARYRFLASPGPPVLVRIVIGEYLACEVTWET
jgi:hypothetical protein